MDFVQKQLSNLLIKVLSGEVRTLYKNSTHTYEQLVKCIRPGDVLLVEGHQRFSMAVKYLTQSNWSHSALYVGNEELIEADLELGVQKILLRSYEKFHTRICRPVELSEEDLKNVLDYAHGRLGHDYDLKNIIDLARYLFPAPPVPDKWKRSFLELGSGDPTKVICSSMIAEAFQSIRYPILPLVKRSGKKVRFFKRKHHTLFTPADFDRSPYFQIVKPTVEDGFDYHNITWETLTEQSPFGQMGKD